MSRVIRIIIFAIIKVARVVNIFLALCVKYSVVR
jgi:hypothetical protein